MNPNIKIELKFETSAEKLEQDFSNDMDCFLMQKILGSVNLNLNSLRSLNLVTFKTNTTIFLDDTFFVKLCQNMKHLFQMRWKPFDLPPTSTKTDFVEGIHTVCGAGDPKLKHGLAIHVYSCNIPMKNRALYCADGDLLIGMTTITIFF